MKTAAIIPVRYASSRLPGKPLAMIGDMTMLQRTYIQAQKAINDVWIATSDDIIAQEAARFGGKVIITSENPRSGTERCAEAATLLPDHTDIIINIQGDEPFIAPDDILRLTERLSNDSSCQIATLIRRFDLTDDITTLTSPDNPKVIIDAACNSIYFSRAVIPYVRDYPLPQWPQHADYYLHTGTYAFRAETLSALAALPPSMLDSAESLEQLRWLSAGYKIASVLTTNKSISIDTPADLAAANRYIDARKP